MYYIFYIHKIKKVIAWFAWYITLNQDYAFFLKTHAFFPLFFK